MQKKRRSKALRIVILSGGTGRTGEQVIRAALAQFDEPNVKIVMKRHVRTQHAALESYSDLRQIAKELRDALALMNQHGWRTIDVSYMAVEEVAGEIVDQLEQPIA